MIKILTCKVMKSGRYSKRDLIWKSAIILQLNEIYRIKIITNNDSCSSAFHFKNMFNRKYLNKIF